MNPRTIKSLSFALLGLLLFFAVVILFKIYSDKDVPAQFTGALLGAIVTAAITMALPAAPEPLIHELRATHSTLP